VTGRVLVRCDGTEDTGLGHVSRCLALAEALEERGAATLFCGAFGERAAGLLTAAGRPSQPAAPDLAELARERGCSAIVLDSYALDAQTLEALAPARTGLGLLVIDDFAAFAEYPAGAIVLNFTVVARDLVYRGRDLVRLLGPEHLLVRRALRELRARERTVRRPPRHVLMALGGGDPFGLAVGLAGTLTRAFPELTVHLPASAYGELPERVTALDDAQLAPGFAWADIAVTGGGLTKYEAAYLGVPPLAISQSDGEAADTERFVAAGLGADAGHAASTGPEDRERALLRYVRDAALHDRLRAAAARVFPTDPTARVAEIVLETALMRP